MGWFEAFRERISAALHEAVVDAKDGLPIRLWWQNLSRDDRESDAPLHGRATLWLGSRERAWIGTSWNLRSTFAHLGARLDDDAEMVLSVAFPPVALWFAFGSWELLRGAFRRWGERETRLSFHDGSFWWNLWTDPNGWSNETPRWRQGSFNVVDALLGAEQVSKQAAGVPVAVKVPLPEGVYDASVVLFEMRRERPRWFSAYSRHAEIVPARAIPIPGKGENAWDCADDGIYSLCCKARGPADAVTKLVGNVLRARERHGGLGWMPPGTTPVPAPPPPPPPEEAFPPSLGLDPEPVVAQA